MRPKDSLPAGCLPGAVAVSVAQRLHASGRLARKSPGYGSGSGQKKSRTLKAHDRCSVIQLSGYRVLAVLTRKAMQAIMASTINANQASQAEAPSSSVTPLLSTQSINASMASAVCSLVSHCAYASSVAMLNLADIKG